MQKIFTVSLAAVLAVLTTIPVFAQISYTVQHQPPTAVERGEPQTFDFTVPGIRVDEVEEAFLYYRMGGDFSYRQERAELNQDRFSVEIDIPERGAGLFEYYFVVDLFDGRQITYPDNYALTEEPVRVEVVEPRDKKPPAQATVGQIEYTILSPEPGTGLPEDDALIALTLFYEEESIDTTNYPFMLLLDDQDITDQAKAGNYFFSYAPETIQPGNHRVTLLLKQGEGQKEIVSWEFTVFDPDAPADSPVAPDNPLYRWIPQGRAELTVRNQVIAGETNDVIRGNIQFSGSRGNVRYSGYGLLSTQESSRLQPQNRYNAEFFVGDWLELEAGHVYPTMNSMTISGRRILGVNALTYIPNTPLNVQLMFGQMSRSITNRYTNIQPEVQMFGGDPVDTTYTIGFREDGAGTYKRKIAGGRIGFEKGRDIDVGLSFLRIQDDTTSISVVSDFNDVLSGQPQLADGLNQQHIDNLTNNPEKLTVDGNPVPKGNFITSLDYALNLKDERIQIRGEGGMSLFNENITGGILTNDNDLGVVLPESTANLIDWLSWLVIINENMNVLPFRFEVEGDTTFARTIIPPGILATQNSVNLNYFDHNAQIQYRWVGPNYVSLGNSTIRRDVRGFTLTDRFRVLDNRLYINITLERLRDNLTNNRESTTGTFTYRSNFSWYPVRESLPRVSLGLMYRKRDNDISLTNPFVAPELEDAAVQNYEIIDGTPSLTASPRFNNTYQIHTSLSKEFELLDLDHEATFNFSHLGTRDRVFAFGDTRNNNLGFSITSYLDNIPLNTNLSVSYNSTETLSGNSESDIFGINLGGSLFLLDEKLNLNANLAFTRNNFESGNIVINENGTPNDTSDDFFAPETDGSGNRVITRTQSNLYILRGGARYNITNHHSVILDLNFTNVRERLGDIDPSNDRILLARYIYRL